MFKTFERQSPVDTVLQILWAEPKVARQAGCASGTCQERHTRLALWRTMIRRVHATNRAGWDEYIPLWQALKLQARYNSPLFTSHGIGHSMRSAYYMDVLLPTGASYRNAALWTALLHDVGYSEYGLCQNPATCDEMKQRLMPLVGGDSTAKGLSPENFRAKKFLHAALGANMVRRILRTSPRLFLQPDRIVRAIQDHNADTHSKTRYDPEHDGSLMTIANYCVQRAYVPAVFEKRPLLTLVRLADNLDMVRARLTPEQRSCALLCYQKWLRDTPGPDESAKLAEWRRLCGLYPDIGNETVANLLFEKSTPGEFKYTYSSWILHGLDIIECNWDEPRLEIEVVPYETQVVTLRFENNAEVGLYQLKRLYGALESIFAKGKTMANCTWVTLRGKRSLLVNTFRPNYIIDSDIGDDVDDAYAVSIALDLHARRQINIRYIIASGHGHSEQRARLFHKLCVAKNVLDIPIVRGMTTSTSKSKAHYMAVGDGAAHFPTLQEKMDEIRRSVQHGTTVLCIGPLDNIRQLNLPSEKVNVVLMGGCFEHVFDGTAGHIAEYNVKHGIPAWRWALEKYKNALVVPLDTAGRGRVPWGTFTTTDTPIAHLLREMSNAWYADHLASHSGKLPPILMDGEGCDIHLDSGTNSNIQFDSVALFLSLQLDQCVLNHGRVVVDAQGKTSMAQRGSHRVAVDWKEGGLAAFQKWFRTHIGY